MGSTQGALTGPDLGVGVPETDVVEGKPLLGHTGGEAVLLVRHGDQLYAMGAVCSHYGGPLAEGLQVGSTVRCPWHHARFDASTGGVVGCPALSPLTCYRLERANARVRVLGKAEPRVPAKTPGPGSVVIVGGGAAGQAAAQTLRAEGYAGPVTLLSADEQGPYDRPNLSKDYLAGTAPEEWIPLKPPDFYGEQRIQLKTGARVVQLDPKKRELRLADGSVVGYDALLLATGAEPVRLAVPGGNLPHVLTLRSLQDCRAILGRIQAARRAVVVGAGFLGMEVAASLRHRGVEVDVVGPQARPLEKVLGPALGDLLREVHEAHGVRFHLGQKVAGVEETTVTLESGARLAADLVIVAIGVRPQLGVAEAAGLQVDRGVKVNALLETSAPGIWAAGDIARWPDLRSGPIRVEHWVVAQRQGQTAARNMLGRMQAFTQAPFFWTTQYDLTIAYVGHAERWDELQVDGDVRKRDASVRYKLQGKTLALATVNRDIESLRVEAGMEESAPS